MDEANEVKIEMADGTEEVMLPEVNPEPPVEAAPEAPAEETPESAPEADAPAA